MHEVDGILPKALQDLLMKTQEALEDSSITIALGITPFRGRRLAITGIKSPVLCFMRREGKAILASPLLGMQGKQTQSAKAGDRRHWGAWSSTGDSLKHWGQVRTTTSTYMQAE